MTRFLATFALAIGLLLDAKPSDAELVGYWTLDNLTTGIENQGTNGAASNMTIGGNPTATTGFLGGGIAFDGSGDMLSTTGTGTAAAQLTAYPLSFSYWVRLDTTPANRSTGLSINQLSANNVNYGSGINAADRAYITSRNTTFDADPYDTDGPEVVDGQWHHVMGVFAQPGPHPNDGWMYVDGKLAATSFGETFGDQSFNSNVNTIAIGGVRRSNAAPDNPNDPMLGELDDVGLWNSELLAADAALINGLARTGSIALDQHVAARQLWNRPVGATAEIGGVSFQRVSGLNGVTGDYSGTTAGGDASITLGGNGLGIQQTTASGVLIHEPFNYTAGGLNAQNPGWTGGFNVISPGLEHPMLLGESGLAAKGQGTNATTSLGTTIGDGDETVYLSFLMQTDSNQFTGGGSFQTIELHGGGVREYAIGLLRGDGNTASTQFEYRAYDLTNADTPELGAFTDEVVLLVAKLDYTNGGDSLTIDAWLNPDGTTDFDLESNRITILSGAFSFDQLRMVSAADSGFGHTGATFDEIRLAFTPPTLAPEPSTYVLGLLGALGVVACFRRRRNR